MVTYNLKCEGWAKERFYQAFKERRNVNLLFYEGFKCVMQQKGKLLGMAPYYIFWKMLNQDIDSIG